MCARKATRPTACRLTRSNFARCSSVSSTNNIAVTSQSTHRQMPCHTCGYMLSMQAIPVGNQHPVGTVALPGLNYLSAAVRQPTVGRKKTPSKPLVVHSH